jgi:hypothetical protein
LIFSNLEETNIGHSILCNQCKRLKQIWHNKGDAESNAIASERFLKLFLIAAQFTFPGIYIRAVFGKCGMLWKNVGIEFYVYIKIIIAFIVLYFQLFRFTICGHHVFLCLTIYLTIETILYVATLIFCSDVFAKPRSYKRSIILVFLNYFEIATFYLAAGALKFTDGTDVVKSLDAAYFSFITAVTIGYGDITPVAGDVVVKKLIIIQSIIFLVFGVIFLNFFVSNLSSPNISKNIIKEENC